MIPATPNPLNLIDPPLLKKARLQIQQEQTWLSIIIQRHRAPAMSDEKKNVAELLQLARDYASKDIDLYSVLGIASTTSDKDVHRAWRRQNLKYHPDKTGAAFDAEKYE